MAANARPHIAAFKLSPGATYSVKAALKGYVSSTQSVALVQRPGNFVPAGAGTPSPTTPYLPGPAKHPSWPGWSSRESVPVINCLWMTFEFRRVGPSGTWELTPGSHRLRLLSGTSRVARGPTSVQSECNLGAEPWRLQTACSSDIRRADCLEPYQQHRRR